MKNRIISILGRFIFVVSILFSSFGFGFETQRLALTSLENDLFTDFLMAIGALDYYNSPTFVRCYIRAVSVNFGKKGNYYEQEKGENYWTYYFEPLEVGEAKQVMRFNKQQRAGLVNHARTNVTLAKAHELINTYIQIKPFITEQVESFYENNLKDDFAIGLHYAYYNSNIHESPSPTLERLHSAISQILESHHPESFKIFLSTQDSQCFEFLDSKFPGHIITTPPEPLTAFEKGEKLLIDCLLLSRCNVLLHTGSNLTHTAAQFNPDITMEDLK